jgi:hypothetical protein
MLTHPDVLLPIPVSSAEVVPDMQLEATLEFFEHFLNAIGRSDAVNELVFLEFVGGIVGHELSITCQK